MDSRQHRRVRMRLPARLRWTTPLGQKIELAHTIDASRGGLLVSTNERHAPGVTVWVTFPHDASLSDGQPEIPGRVVRCDEVLEVIPATNARERFQASASEQERGAKLDQLARGVGFSDAPPTFAVAFQFETQPSSSSNGHAQRSESERRNHPRKTLAIPIRVHPEQIPWFEEAMTLDISEKGMRFRSQREYASGDRLKIAFANPASAPWHGTGEFLSEVVRITPIAGSAALDVSVFRVN